MLVLLVIELLLIVSMLVHLDLDSFNNEAALKDALALLQKLEPSDITDKHIYVGDLYWYVSFHLCCFLSTQ